MGVQLTEEEKRIIDALKEVLPKIPEEKKEGFLIGVEFLASFSKYQ